MLAKSVERQFLELYENLAEPLFRHCYFRLSDREKARDLMQESFTRTWERLVDGEKIKNLKAFVYRVANNLIIDIYRKKKESSLDLLQEDGFDPGSDDHEAILSMIADFSVTIPTIIKTYQDPTSEPSTLWILYVIGVTLEVVATRQFTVYNLLFPVYTVFGASIITVLALRGRFKKTT